MQYSVYNLFISVRLRFCNFLYVCNSYFLVPLAGCQYCTHRCHCSPGRKIIRPYPIDQQDKLFLDPDVDVKTEKLLEKSEDVATEIRGCLNTAMHNEVPNLSENPQGYILGLFKSFR